MPKSGKKSFLASNKIPGNQYIGDAPHPSKKYFNVITFIEWQFSICVAKLCQDSLGNVVPLTTHNKYCKNI